MSAFDPKRTWPPQSDNLRKLAFVPNLTAEDCVRRRDFIKVIGGSAAVWPLAARAQPGERVRLIGVIHSGAADDPNIKARNAAFLQALQQLGWTDGRTFGSTYVGPRLMPNLFANIPRNW